ncbi:MAG TPA: hypothetical protein DEG17_13945 [Cyanobacteria bacterium UBA11149]|nr:hypothetical protein [Cyanobacteria bacterium UBA11367]HBE56018.1 hypothetical protein [Cyanobacteria bacterium UBA11366]HBK62489.1 hypothetical protein [Cyanobacteria bacterium UBA11166]HBR73761.1 hypothetical protein [Cyanobacteria bacterium UBA11159]HBS67652.1 hypothetical protein [Cyanobacteria bacterium UBA11153]HBW89941.1 hypothetical protein [Cyanobacteria bacterium UBA11149]HCA94098.1 hypothetical protein [Cyanobacteria bacterium UBA9226]
MSRVYSTEELIKIIADERRACMNGERLNLAASASGNPLLDRFLQRDGIQKFTAYRDFKAAVHVYQREHQVSGILWRQITIKEHNLEYPAVDEQLIALDRDLEILKNAKPSILDFWWAVTKNMDLYLSMNIGRDYCEIGRDRILAIARQTEWANLFHHGNSDNLEIILQLGWGQPEEAAYKRGWPTSGSEYIHAVNPGKRPIC